MTIAIYDTYCGSFNSGDAIIMDAINQQIRLLFPYEHTVRYPTHYPLTFKAIRRIKKSSRVFVGGTNLLSSNIFLSSKKNQWAISQAGAMHLKQHAILFGCGWKNYNEPTTRLSRLFYKTILSQTFLHSVRDSYTEQKMRALGIDNVINTGCPTLWRLTPDHCAKIPTLKSEQVVFTLTDYRQAPDADRALISTLFANYKKIFFWKQGANDLEYLQSLIDPNAFDQMTVIGPALMDFDQLLTETESLEYVGTRLHAAIRAMQKGRRSLIIGVDNRAREKQIDFSLNVLDRDNISDLSALINSEMATHIALPVEKIDLWRRQFRPEISSILIE